MFSRSAVLATAIMIMAQLTLAIITIANKYLIRRSASMRILVAHRLVAGAVILLAYWVVTRFFTQRGRNGPKLTWKVICLGFLCGFLGGFASSNIYVVSFSLGSASAATAISNMSPAISLIMAVVFRLETLNFRTLPDNVKVLGTLMAIVGAMVISFYEGGVIKLWPDSYQIDTDPSTIPYIVKLFDLPKNAQFLAVLSAILSCITSSASIIVEAKIMQIYPCPGLQRSHSYYGSSTMFGFCVPDGWLQCHLVLAVPTHSVCDTICGGHRIRADDGADSVGYSRERTILSLDFRTLDDDRRITSWSCVY